MPGEAFTPSLLVHIIPPKNKLDWSTPRALFLSTLLNHVKNDSAPIGHFYVELKFERSGKFFHYLTGMSRAKKFQSTLEVFQKILGLLTFFYSFAGRLDRAKESLEQIEAHRRERRLRTLMLKLDSAQAERVERFLQHWIRVGADQVYGGGVHPKMATGSGCAEFALYCLKLVLNDRPLFQEWERAVFAPESLFWVSGLTLMTSTTPWAKSVQHAREYRVPDPELAYLWHEKIAQNEPIIVMDIRGQSLPDDVLDEPQYCSNLESPHALLLHERQPRPRTDDEFKDELASILL